MTAREGVDHAAVPSFEVGYRAYLVRDASRTYGTAETTRPILVALWYPSALETGAPLMCREDYLAIDTTEGADEDREFAERLSGYTREIVSGIVLGKERHRDPSLGSVLEQFWREPTRAVRDAPRAEGVFPLVVTHPGFGGTFLDNAALCEYLAAHGYMAAASAYQPEDSSTFHIGCEMSLSVRDMAFLADHLSALPGTGRIGVVGHSYGGQTALAWAAEPGSAVRAAVSLDTTLEYVHLEEEEVRFENRIRVNMSLREVRTRFDAARATFTTPLLVFTQARMHPGYALYERLTHAEQYYAEMKDINHFDFDGLHALTRSLRPADAESSDFARASYGTICRLTRTFLDSVLRDNEDAKAANRRITATAAEEGDTVRLIHQAGG